MRFLSYVHFRCRKLLAPYRGMLGRYGLQVGLKYFLLLCGLLLAFRLLFFQSQDTDSVEYPKTNSDMEYIASNLRLDYVIERHYGPRKCIHCVTFYNEGQDTILAGDWSIYFTSVLRMQSVESFPNKHNNQFILEHIDGRLHKLSPLDKFALLPAQQIQIEIKAPFTTSRHYVMPRWYVASPNEAPHVIKCTGDNNINFVEQFQSHQQLNALENEISNKFSLEDRYERYLIKDFGHAPKRVIPAPLRCNLHDSDEINLHSGSWVICSGPRAFEREIDLISSLFGISVLPEGGPTPPTHIVKFLYSAIKGLPNTKEAYQIFLSSEKNIIEITASGSAGAFYAIQTLLSLATNRDGETQPILPSGFIQDAPRFGYRGLHVDVARNFLPADEIINIIETMALYKLNRFHFHLTDDEGWRIEIDGLPELTSVGAVRRHSDDEHDALFPALGSSPNGDGSGSGFYTKEDYQRILRVAANNHVEVIPEIDTPGHSHAAIRAMEARHRRLLTEGRPAEAKKYLLSDPRDHSNAMSVQSYRDNSINPCKASTYVFMEHVLKEMKKMHSEIQPLRMIHIGGDEVASKSWIDSPVCRKFLSKSHGFPYSISDLQEYFMRKVAKICADLELGMGIWEDGGIGPEHNLYDKNEMHGTDITAYAWKSSSPDKPHKLANNGYKVILAQATHLYFDHPQEPDLEERGLHWATRFIDDRKVFGFQPDDLVANVEGQGPDEDLIREPSVPLTKPENIIGMQTELWSELIRDVTIAHSQLFPRLIAFAERAWHKSKWEQESDRYTAKLMRNRDWDEFSNAVGYRELARLRKRGIRYRLPPPGVKLVGNEVEICSLYPGLEYRHRVYGPDGSPGKWEECENGSVVDGDEFVHEYASYDGERWSRIVKSSKMG
ncbi:beta-hexosaminidase-like isoform X2 [Clavelina lepadiformis]|uniref:beta-hexosaminidase-like isoform X2 n=1 Tax=Clavelina lepadiformis TaxID=159417 RepID=UPI004042C83F